MSIDVMFKHCKEGAYKKIIILYYHCIKHHYILLLFHHINVIINSLLSSFLITHVDPSSIF